MRRSHPLTVWTRVLALGGTGICFLHRVAEMGELLDSIEWQSVEALNQNPSHPVSNALKQGYREDDHLYLESDTDEQLLIHIPFSQVVKLQSIAIKSAAAEGRAPRRVKLFINRASLGFSEAADFAPVQELELTPEQVEAGEPIALKYVKFQKLTHLTIFIEDNQGDEDVTRVQRIQLLGVAQDTFDVAKIKKVEEG